MSDKLHINREYTGQALDTLLDRFCGMLNGDIFLIDQLIAGARTKTATGEEFSLVKADPGKYFVVHYDSAEADGCIIAIITPAEHDVVSFCGDEEFRACVALTLSALIRHGYERYFAETIREAPSDVIVQYTRSHDTLSYRYKAGDLTALINGGGLDLSRIESFSIDGEEEREEDFVDYYITSHFADYISA